MFTVSSIRGATLSAKEEPLSYVFIKVRQGFVYGSFEEFLSRLWLIFNPLNCMTVNILDGYVIEWYFGN